MPGEEMARQGDLRWSLPGSPVPPDEGEIELGRAIREELQRGYELLLSAALDWEHRRRVPLLGILPEPRGIPCQEVDVSPETLSYAWDSWADETLARWGCEGIYGTSGELEPRGYWMPIDGEAR